MKFPRSLSFGVVLVVAGCSADDGKPSSPITIPSSDAGASDASGDGGKKALAEDCTADAECESGICWKGSKSSWCSTKCTPTNAKDVCTGIFAGDCNQQGYCRRPN